MHTGIQDNAAYNANRKRASQAHTPQFYSHQLQPSYAPEPPKINTGPIRRKCPCSAFTMCPIGERKAARG
jgi:hypothetical protein